MPTRIRLQRYGKKHAPFYHIVVADGRAPRDGKFIETIGTYNPLTNPADITLDFDKALNWMQKGAQPSDTARAILSYKGVIYKNHLLKGVKKGAMTEEQAEAKFNVWLKEKNDKIDKKVSSVQTEARELEKQRLAEETKINEAKASAIAKRKADELEKEVEKIQENATEESTEKQDNEVRTPKEVELKEAIEAKDVVEVKETEKTEDKKEDVVVTEATTEKKEEETKEKTEKEEEKK